MKSMFGDDDIAKKDCLEFSEAGISMPADDSLSLFSDSLSLFSSNRDTNV